MTREAQMNGAARGNSAASVARTVDRAFKERLSGARVVVLGLGKSGLAAARLLAAQGAQVVANDGRDASAFDDSVLKALEDLGITLALGGHAEETYTSADLVVVSPGVPPLPVLEKAVQAGVPVVAEVELASWFIDAPLLAVTGTNGKSTVVSLLGAMAEASGRLDFLGGNLVTPLSEVVGTGAAAKDGLVIVELSSFQLERVFAFRAQVAVLLNVTEDQFERYDSFEAYAAAKGEIFNGQQPGDFAVLPAGDALCEALYWKFGGATATRFSTHGHAGESTQADCIFVDGQIRLPGAALVLDRTDLPLAGTHNVDNACAAMLAGHRIGLTNDAILAGLRSFKGLPHRMEQVRVLDGVSFYDDSKATNVGATVAALQSLGDTPVVLIAGGRDKDGGLEDLVAAMTHVRSVVLLGEAADRFASALDGLVPLLRATSLEDATQKAAAAAQAGDAVLLAPACSSFDMFRSYAARGDAFQAAVRALTGVGPASAAAKGGAS